MPFCGYSNSSDRDQSLIFRPGKRVAQRPAERFALDFNDVVWLGGKPILTTESTGPKEMDVHIAGAPEHRILEMMMFQVRDGVGHILFTGYDTATPDRLPISNNADRTATFDGSSPK